MRQSLKYQNCDLISNSIITHACVRNSHHCFLFNFKPELIRKYGYEVQLHNVITDDGYVLTHHRIPYGRKQNKRTDRPVILLQHGLLGSSSDWIIKTPGSGLGKKSTILGLEF